MAMRAYIHNKKLEVVVLVQRRAVDSYSRAQPAQFGNGRVEVPFLLLRAQEKSDYEFEEVSPMNLCWSGACHSVAAVRSWCIQ